MRACEHETTHLLLAKPNIHGVPNFQSQVLAPQESTSLSVL